MSGVCERCGATFDRRPGPGRPRVFCSEKCARAAVRARYYTKNRDRLLAASAEAYVPRNRHVSCPRCGTLVRTDAPTAHCDACRTDAKRERDRRREADPRRRAYRSIQGARRRAAKRMVDVTPEYEVMLRASRKRCPKCRCSLTDEAGKPNSKHIDHIVPLAHGGTHTVGNIRVLCARCNLSRRDDVADLVGFQTTLWAQVPGVAPRSPRRRLPGAHLPAKVVVCGVCRSARAGDSGVCRGCSPPRLKSGPAPGSMTARAADLYVQGFGYKWIAKELGVSRDTARSMVRRWRDRLGVAAAPRVHRGRPR